MVFCCCCCSKSMSAILHTTSCRKGSGQNKMGLMRTPGKLQANLGQTPGGTGQWMNDQMMLWGSEHTNNPPPQLQECVVASTLDCQGTTPTQSSHKPMQKEAVHCKRTTSPIQRSQTFKHNPDRATNQIRLRLRASSRKTCCLGPPNFQSLGETQSMSPQVCRRPHLMPEKTMRFAKAWLPARRMPSRTESDQPATGFE